jgi:hypothetical protein
VNLRLEVPSGTLLAYLALAGAGHFLWETAQLPLYTIWSTGTRLDILFAVIHCTAGDLLITVFALAFAALAARIGRWPFFGNRMALTAILLGLWLHRFQRVAEQTSPPELVLHREDAPPAAIRHGSYPLSAIADRAGDRVWLRPAKSQAL